MQRGVTATEFASMCARHAPRGRIPIESTVAFLERCCDLGLLRKEQDRHCLRYFPTQAANALVEDDD